MRHIILLLGIAWTVALTACGGGFQAATGGVLAQSTPTPFPSPSPSSSPSPAPIVSPSPSPTPSPSPAPVSLNASQIQSLESSFTTLLGALLSNALNPETLINATGGTLSISSTVPCASGGSASLSGSVTGTFSTSLPSIGAVYHEGNPIALSFANCQVGSGLGINGSIGLSNLSGSASVTIEGLSSPLSGQSSSQISGSMQVTVGGVPLSCAIALNNTSTLQGLVTIGDPISASGSTSFSLNGSLCSVNFTKQLTINF